MITVNQGYVDAALRCYDRSRGHPRQSCFHLFARAFNLNARTFRKAAWSPHTWAAYTAVKRSCAKRFGTARSWIVFDYQNRRCLLKRYTAAGRRTDYTNCIRGGSVLMQGLFGWGCTLANYDQDEATFMACAAFNRGRTPARSVACSCNALANSPRISMRRRLQEYQRCIKGGMTALSKIFSRAFSWINHAIQPYMRYSPVRRLCPRRWRNPTPQTTTTILPFSRCRITRSHRAPRVTNP